MNFIDGTDTNQAILGKTLQGFVFCMVLAANTYFLCRTMGLNGN